MHENLRRKNLALEKEFESAPFNRATIKGGFGLIASGHACVKAENVLDSYLQSPISILKLGTTNPLPPGIIEEYLWRVPEVLVCEDNHPFIEKGVRELANRLGVPAGIYGRITGHFPWPGELSESVIHQAVSQFARLTPFQKDPQAQAWEYGTLKPYPKGCPNINIFGALHEAVNELDIEPPVFIGDSGCGVRSMSLPYKTLDVKLCMGSSVGVARGLVKGGVKGRAVALMGDSSFFHTGINSILSAIHNRADLMIVILNNYTTATTGRQPHPGTGGTASGQPGTRISIEALLKTGGVGHVKKVDTGDIIKLKKAFKEGLTMSGLAVIIADGPCPMIKS